MRRFLAALCAGVVTIGQAHADVTFSVSVDDPQSRYASYHDAIVSHLAAAGATWSEYLAGTSVLQLQVGFADIPTADAASATSGFLRRDGGLDLYEQGAAAKVRTGLDPNGSAPDGVIRLGPGYLASELYFGPDPLAGAGPVPADRTDAYSLFLHEIGHVLAFNGWRSATTGLLAGDYQSAFDALTVLDGPDAFFVGAQAQAAYGGSVPLTYGTMTGDSGHVAHLGNPPPRPGADLAGDLMSGVRFDRGRRYAVSALDAAVLCDVGIPGPRCVMPVDEPGTALLVACLALLGCVRTRRLRQSADQTTGAPR